VSKTDFSGVFGREENTTGRVVVTWRRIARCARNSSGHAFGAWSRQVRSQGYASASIVFIWLLDREYC